MAKCPNCENGTIICTVCNGKGYQRGLFLSKKDCPECGSIGYFNCTQCAVCSKCNGTGKGFLFSKCVVCEGSGREDIFSPTERGDWHLQRGEYHTARKNYELAADKRDAQAMYNLGIIHEQGLGVQRSHNLAQEWFNKAKRHDHAGAKQIIKKSRARNWKIQRVYCNNCKRWRSNLYHKGCASGEKGSVLYIDLEYFEVLCNKCNKIWPLENHTLYCSCGHVQNTEYSKETLIIGKNDRLIEQDGDTIYVLDHSGKLIVGRRTYYGQGYVD